MADKSNSEEQDRAVDQISNVVRDQLSSRRNFLTKTAVAGTGMSALLASGTGNVAAQDGDHGDDPSDVDILNFALTLERLEYNFYADALEEFGEQHIENTEIAQYFAYNPLRYSVYQRLADIRDHEEAHVHALVDTIEDLGGDPVERAEYDFGYDSFEEFVAIGWVLENTGVAAYAGAAPLIDNADLIPPALSIHSVEARHASYLGVLNKERVNSPFPNAFDPAKTMDEVLEAAGQFITE